MISDAYTIMSHGSVTLIFFHYIDGLQSLLFVPTTKPQKVRDIVNTCDIIFIIEFQLASFFPFSKINQKDLTDKILSFLSFDAILDQSLRDILNAASAANILLTEIERKLMSSIQLLLLKFLILLFIVPII